MPRHLPALLVLSLAAGCASSFRYDPDDAPPPPPLREPTTLPARVENDVATFRGALRTAFVEFPSRLYRYFTGDTPSADAVALEDSRLPDRRRVGINKLAEYPFGKRPPYTTRYAQIARFDAEPGVRATALRALNLSRDGEAAGLFVAGLADENPQVRLEAAKALANVPDRRSVDGLLRVFNNANEDLDIRIAAADALKQYRSLEIARALVNVLTDREFGLAYQARQSLRTMTGADQRYDQSAWLSYLTGPENPLG